MSSQVRWKNPASWTLALHAKKEDDMNPFKRILVATDFTDSSKPAFEEAIELAQRNGSELLIGHAYQPPIMTQADAVAPGVYDEWDRNLRFGVEQKLQELVNDAKKNGILAKPLVLTGAPNEAIVDAAKENKADLVVMGTHGRKGVSRFFLGSVASRVISTSPCPVMTVRAA
jgi:nucleotide-binding universal stress UspA family protein